MNKIKVLSLFDGISCARVALDRLGYTDVEYYASEIDRYAMQVSAKNYPDIMQCGTVVGLGHQLPNDIDLLIGGSPCQDLSIAKNNRKGLLGERSGLFFEYVRILKEVKPKYFILENVASMPKEAKEQITEIMGVEPIMINAALVSAQNRKRLFWTNIPGVTQPEDRGIMLKDVLEDNPAIAPVKSHTIRTSGRGSGLGDKHNWDTIRIGQIGKGGQGDRIYSPEGKSVNLSANGGGRGAKTGLYMINPKMQNFKKNYDKSVSLTSSMYKEPPLIVSGVALRNRGQGKKPEIGGEKANSMTTVPTDSMVAYIPEATKKGYAIAHQGQSVDLSFPNSKTRRGRVGDKAKNIMTSSTIGVVDGTIIRKLTPIECERLQSLPDNYTEGISNSQRYKALGNAFNVEVVKHILSFMK